MKPGILSRKELAAWVAPAPLKPNQFAIFHATRTTDAPLVSEYIYGTANGTSVGVERIFVHSQHGPTEYPASCWRYAEPDVLIAAGVEAQRRLAGAAPAPEPLFYILSMKRPTPYVLTWYRPGANGYTVHLGSAGKFTRAEAQPYLDAPDSTLILPCEVVDSMTSLIVPDEKIVALRAAALKGSQ